MIKVLWYWSPNLTTKSSNFLQHPIVSSHTNVIFKNICHLTKENLAFFLSVVKSYLVILVSSCSTNKVAPVSISWSAQGTNIWAPIQSGPGLDWVKTSSCFHPGIWRSRKTRVVFWMNIFLWNQASKCENRAQCNTSLVQRSLSTEMISWCTSTKIPSVPNQ